MEKDRRSRDRRQDHTIAVEQVRSIIHEELRHHTSPFKNGKVRNADGTTSTGETKTEWFWRLATPQVLLSLVAAGFSIAVFLVTLGGRAYRLETVGSEALSTAKASAETNARLSGEIEAMRKIIDAQAESLAVSEKMHASKSDLNGIRDQIARITTRPEMSAALRQDLIPRLVRIEQQLAAKP